MLLVPLIHSASDAAQTDDAWCRVDLKSLCSIGVGMNQAAEFRRACRLYDTVLAQQEVEPIQLPPESTDRQTLLEALEYY